MAAAVVGPVAPAPVAAAAPCVLPAGGAVAVAGGVRGASWYSKMPTQKQNETGERRPEGPVALL